MTFEPFDIVIVPFPFSDRTRQIVRPALVLSPHKIFGERTGVVVTAMITAASRSQWPLDVAVTDLSAAGLRAACVIRMKLHTASHQLIDRRIGGLAAADRAAVGVALRALFSQAIGEDAP